ncbi:MAG: Preprotein translocase subunit SecB [Lachnospiraceae bacterium]|nr:Preprotein translocase subunit SecB [Lachnospiraceae bacterium]
MGNGKSIESVLKLNMIAFDKIEFERSGFMNDNELELEILSNISQRQDPEIYKVTLILKGKKPEEYTLEIGLSGYFSIESDGELTEDLKNTLVTKNSVAILMPYLRSEVSLLTAQPEVECVVLPAFNINNMLDN